MNATETKDRSEANYWAEFVADEFERAARGPDMAYHLSTAIDVLKRHAVREAPAIASQAMCQIMKGISASRPVAIMLLSGDTERFLATHAIRETAELALFWGAHPRERHRWNRSRIHEMKQHARWLQNAFHNISIVEELTGTTRYIP
ncbi:MAG: hypothetical protein VX874_17605 [Pseudomonadota bacterium]|nr:hypothetical protein [Pseudomonadota bacterium]